MLPHRPPAGNSARLSTHAAVLLALLEARSPRSLAELREAMNCRQTVVNEAALELADLGYQLEVGPALALLSEPAAGEVA